MAMKISFAVVTVFWDIASMFDVIRILGSILKGGLLGGGWRLDGVRHEIGRFNHRHFHVVRI
jgi:hypothetical protein